MAAGEQYIVGLTSDGKVLHLGRNYERQKDCEEWEDIVFIASGRRTIVGLDKTGGIHVAGQDAEELQHYVDSHSEWQDLLSIDVGGDGQEGNTHIIGLKAGGGVLAYMPGVDTYGKCDVKSWDNIKAISAGDDHTVGIREDNTAVVTGKDGTKEYPGKGELDYIENWKNVVAISAGTNYTVALMNVDGKIIIEGAGYEDQGQIDFAGWDDMKVW